MVSSHPGAGVTSETGSFRDFGLEESDRDAHTPQFFMVRNRVQWNHNLRHSRPEVGLTKDISSQAQPHKETPGKSKGTCSRGCCSPKSTAQYAAARSSTQQHTAAAKSGIQQHTAARSSTKQLAAACNNSQQHQTSHGSTQQHAARNSSQKQTETRGNT